MSTTAGVVSCLTSSTTAVVTAVDSVADIIETRRELESERVACYQTMDPDGE